MVTTLIGISVTILIKRNDMTYVGFKHFNRMANLTSVINVQPRISTNLHKLFLPDGNLRTLGIP